MAKLADENYVGLMDIARFGLADGVYGCLFFELLMIFVVCCRLYQ